MLFEQQTRGSDCFIAPVLLYPSKRMDDLLEKLKSLGLPHDPIRHEVVTTAEAQVSTRSIHAHYRYIPLSFPITNVLM